MHIILSRGYLNIAKRRHRKEEEEKVEPEREKNGVEGEKEVQKELRN